MKKLVVLLALVSFGAQAAITNTVNVRSQYIFNGTHGSNGSMVDGSLDYSNANGAYAGVWAANYDGAGDEVDTYIGYATKFGSVTADFMYNRWGFVDNQKANANEFSAVFGHNILNLTIKMYDNWAQYGADSDDKVAVTYVKISKEYAIDDMTTFMWHVGMSSFDDGKEDDAGARTVNYKSWTDWSMGVKRTVDKFSLTFAYSDTNRESNSAVDAEDGVAIEDLAYTMVLSRTF